MRAARSIDASSHRPSAYAVTRVQYRASERQSMGPSNSLATTVPSTAPLGVRSGDEVCFVLNQDDLLALDDTRTLEQVLQQLLGRKVWLLASAENKTVRFDWGPRPALICR